MISLVLFPLTSKPSMNFNLDFFYRHGGHIELLRFKEYYGMPKGHEHDPIHSLSIYACFSGQFFFKFSQKKIVIGKKKALCRVRI